MRPRNSSPKTWPMKWIVVAILVLILPYTWMTVRYRKPGDAYLPYQDNKQRAQVMRLLDAGFQRIALPVERPSDASPSTPPQPHAATTAQPGGMPPALSEVLLDQPLVPGAITRVTAPAIAPSDAPYPIRFSCTRPDHHEQVASARLYLRGRDATLVPAFERLEGGLLSRPRETIAQVVVPAGVLAAGTYRFTIIGARESRTWTVEARRPAAAVEGLKPKAKMPKSKGARGSGESGDPSDRSDWTDWTDPSNG